MKRRKECYLKTLGQRLNQFYISIRDYDKTDTNLRSGVEAFMEAGLLLEGVTQSELESVINEQHKAVFGLSLGERQRSDILSAHSTGNYAAFDTPAWQRKKVKIPEQS
ncbi:hypothetical protein [Amphritea sp. HPY]|uniref:hypothetical protein n=1 Tax=Amphritea sp. HPY TaxID=3421652 RepID=UPI003D7E9C0B